NCRDRSNESNSAEEILAFARPRAVGIILDASAFVIQFPYKCSPRDRKGEGKRLSANSTLPTVRSCRNIPLLTGNIPSAEMGSAHRFCLSRSIGNLVFYPEFADERTQHRRKGYGNGITRAASAAPSRYSQTRGARAAEAMARGPARRARPNSPATSKIPRFPERNWVNFEALRLLDED